jgi:hypothetical protein
LALGIYRDIDGALYTQPAARLNITRVTEQTQETVKTNDGRYIVKLSYGEASSEAGGFLMKDLACQRVGGRLVFDGFTVVMGEEPT